jgi:hypothetical protein
MTRLLSIAFLLPLLTGCASDDGSEIAFDVEVACDLSSGLTQVEAEPGAAPYVVGCDDDGRCQGPISWYLQPRTGLVSIPCDGHPVILVLWL